MSYYDIVRGWFVNHPADTKNPQTYWQHGLFAAWNSTLLILAGIAGIVHAIFPPAFPFYTSTHVIRSFNKLVLSQRHENELEEVFGPNNVSVAEGTHIIVRIPWSKENA